MVNGSHVIFHAQDADKVRGFFKNVLQLGSVDAGHGWLIFALPPAEFAVHPAEDTPHYELYLMCDDIHATMKYMKAKGVEFEHPVKEQRWGLVTAIKLPGGGEMGLYEPRHPTALNLNH
jgi:catechol 2,3-dioxygenase-like lactoylglutathione lyase family enzyme